MIRRNQMAVGRDDRGKMNPTAEPLTDYIFPDEIVTRAFSIKSYVPPERESGRHLPKQPSPPIKKLSLPAFCRSQRKNSTKSPASPSHGTDVVKDSRFQKEMEHSHRDFTEKRTLPRHSSSPRPPGGLVFDLERMDLEDYDDSILDSDESEAEVEDKNLSKKLMKKQHRKLRRALRRTVKFLECERAHKLALQIRVDTLSIMVDQLQQTKDENQSLSYLGLTPDLSRELKKQVAEYQTQLEEEQSKSRKLRDEAESLKKENIKYKEKLRVLMFQHIPNAKMEFEDIGPCNPNVEESDDLVADYELGTELGSGHYGKVCVGTDLSNKKRFAIKVLKKAMISRFKDLQQVAMEIHVLKNYPHPNIVHLEEVIHAPQNLYLVTELCTMDLHKYHNDIGLSEFSAKHVIFGILKPLVPSAFERHLPFGP
jgi:hypothetical protein